MDSEPVVGGGVAGCATARELAADRDVRLLEADQAAGKASGLAAGLIAPTLFYSDLPAVARRANQYFRAFDAICGFEANERQRIELRLPEHETQSREKTRRLTDDGDPVPFLGPGKAPEQCPRFDVSKFCGVVERRDAIYIYTVAEYYPCFTLSQ